MYYVEVLYKDGDPSHLADIVELYDQLNLKFGWVIQRRNPLTHGTVSGIENKSGSMPGNVNSGYGESRPWDILSH
ncbi:hypothetical protein V6N11_034349 [Hibiscus sabdariffa]|uniref:Uncharacterized protein n=1 Tax=Hibiscus sabdariffa TaxID=183260 RepID=A0ABR2A1C1_9ROSI